MNPNDGYRRWLIVLNRIMRSNAYWKPKGPDVGPKLEAFAVNMLIHYAKQGDKNL